MLSVVRGRVAGGESLPRALAGAPGGPVSVQGLLADHDRAQRDLLGAGDAVQRLLEDPAVTDVVVHAARVWVDRGHGLEAVPAPVGSESEVRALAVRLADRLQPHERIFQHLGFDLHPAPRTNS